MTFALELALSLGIDFACPPPGTASFLDHLSVVITFYLRKCPTTVSEGIHVIMPRLASVAQELKNSGQMAQALILDNLDALFHNLEIVGGRSSTTGACQVYGR